MKIILLVLVIMGYSNLCAMHPVGIDQEVFSDHEMPFWCDLNKVRGFVTPLTLSQLIGNLKKRNNEKRTILHELTKDNKVEVVCFILQNLLEKKEQCDSDDAGAKKKEDFHPDVDALTKSEIFSLEIAALLGLQDSLGNTIVHYAAMNNSSDIVDLVLGLMPSDQVLLLLTQCNSYKEIAAVHASEGSLLQNALDPKERSKPVQNSASVFHTVYSFVQELKK